MITKDQIYKFLNDNDIAYELTNHEAVFNMDELSSVDLPYPENDAKNLFIRDDKKRNYYLITVMGNKRVDLKEFRKANDTRPLSFAKDDELMAYLKLTPGSVSPFGLFNDTENKVIFFIDQAFLDTNDLIGCHPNDNTATVWLKASELIDLVKAHGNEVHVIEL